MKIYRIAQINVPDVPQVNDPATNQRVQDAAKNNPDNAGAAMHGVVRQNALDAVATLYRPIYSLFSQLHQVMDQEIQRLQTLINQASLVNSDVDSEAEEKTDANNQEGEANNQIALVQRLQSTLQDIGKEVEDTLAGITNQKLTTAFFGSRWEPIQTAFNNVLTGMVDTIESFTVDEQNQAMQFMTGVRAELDPMQFPADTKRNL